MVSASHRRGCRVTAPSHIRELASEGKTPIYWTLPHKFHLDVAKWMRERGQLRRELHPKPHGAHPDPARSQQGHQAAASKAHGVGTSAGQAAHPALLVNSGRRGTAGGLTGGSWPGSPPPSSQTEEPQPGSRCGNSAVVVSKGALASRHADGSTLCGERSGVCLKAGVGRGHCSVPLGPQTCHEPHPGSTEPPAPPQERASPRPGRTEGP